MKIIKVEVNAEIPFAISEDYRVHDILEVEIEDNLSDEEIETIAQELAKDWFYEMYNYSYNILKK